MADSESAAAAHGRTFRLPYARTLNDVLARNSDPEALRAALGPKKLLLKAAANEMPFQDASLCSLVVVVLFGLILVGSSWSVRRGALPSFSCSDFLGRQGPSDRWRRALGSPGLPDPRVGS